MKSKCLLILLFNCLFINTYSQNIISGKVIDGKTKEPLPGVTVNIKKNAKAVSTDTDGKYSLNVSSGKHTIEVSLIGYHTSTKEIETSNKNIQLDFALEEESRNLNEVIVHANSERAEMKAIRNSPMSVSVVDGIKLRGRATSIEEVLSRTSGMKIRKEGGLGSKSRMSIHGLEGKRVAVFIDGFALNSPDGSFDINDIPIDIIRYIEIYKGIVPAEYGGDGLGGAVNIVTREDDCDLVGLTQEVSSFGTSKTLFSVQKNFEKPGIILGLGGFYNRSDNNYKMTYPVYDTDLPDNAYRKVKRNNDFYDSGMLVFKLGFHKLWFDEIEFEVAAYKNKKEIQSLDFDSRYAHTHGTNIMPTFKLEKEDFFVKGLYFKSSLVVPIVNTHLVDTAHFIRQWDGTINNSLGETSDNLFNDSDDKQNEIRHKLNMRYQLNDFNRFNLNNQFVYSDYKPKDEYMIDYLGFDPSAFPSKMTSNITGLAHEYFSAGNKLQNSLIFNIYYLKSEIYRTGDKIVNEDESVKKTPGKTGVDKFYYGFSEGLSYEFLKGIRVKGSFAHAVRLPDTGELFGDGITIKPSVDLKPEKSNNINLGFIVDRTDLWKINRLQVETNLYYMNITDMISLFPADTRMINTNLGKTQIKGVDLDIKLDATENIYGYFNITYQSIKDKLKWKTNDKSIPNPTYDKNVPNIPRFFYNYGLEYHGEGILAKNELSRIYVDGSYTDDFEWSWQMSKRPDQKKKWMIPGSHIISAGIQQSFLKNQLSLGFEVDNIFNKENFMEYKMPLAGRSFKIKLRFNWFRDKSAGGAMGL